MLLSEVKSFFPKVQTAFFISDLLEINVFAYEFKIIWTRKLSDRSYFLKIESVIAGKYNLEQDPIRIQKVVEVLENILKTFLLNPAKTHYLCAEATKKNVNITKKGNI